MKTKHIIQICILVAVTILFVAPSYAALTDGLVGYWKFEEGSGNTTADSSGLGNTGTLVNMEPGDWVTGKVGGALEFDGSEDEHVDCGIGSSLNITGTFTIAAWVYADSWPTVHSTIYSRYSGNSGYELRRDSSVMKIIVADGSSWYGAGGVDSDTPLSEWLHVVGTFDNSYLQLYINGVAKGSPSSANAPAAVSASACIGERSGDAGNNWNGIIDEVAIYDRALDTSEIELMYNTGLAGNPLENPIPEPMSAVFALVGLGFAIRKKAHLKAGRRSGKEKKMNRTKSVLILTVLFVLVFSVLTAGNAYCEGKKYAVLYNGGYQTSLNAPRYMNDTRQMYDVLLNVYNFSENDVFVLQSDGKNSSNDSYRWSSSSKSWVSSQWNLDGDGDDDIESGVANSTNLFAKFDELAGIMDYDDLFYFWATDHGDRNGGNSELAGWGSTTFTDAAFATAADQFNVGTEVYVFGQCNSGGFADELTGDENRIIATASTATELSYGYENATNTVEYVQGSYENTGDYDCFLNHWAKALSDGVVSLYDAFVYAELNDEAGPYEAGLENPVWDDYSSIGELVSLNGWEVNPAVSRIEDAISGFSGLSYENADLELLYDLYFDSEEGIELTIDGVVWEYVIGHPDWVQEINPNPVTGDEFEAGGKYYICLGSGLEGNPIPEPVSCIGFVLGIVGLAVRRMK